MFVYACVGMSLFKDVKHNGVVNDAVNFETFGEKNETPYSGKHLKISTGRSILLLFRLSTSAGWNDVTEAYSIEEPQCNSTYKDLPNGNCGDAINASIFFSTFVAVLFLIVVNMYIAVILDNLISTNTKEHEIPADVFEDYYVVWKKFDPDATQMIRYGQIPNLLVQIPDPLR